ncbi:MAG: GIY-YIG nuclease family protein [Eggerthellaceae bacterium]|nr:GIY-YIG nuclease family protein [Eggerthellaceae bacterium]
MTKDGAWVYILTNYNHTTLYIGVTTDLERRMAEHKSHALPGFTQNYNVDRLVYVERTQSIRDAIEREKQLKRWGRKKKEKLIESSNPLWRDLSES